ncbi:MAG: sigma 54-interacting transcriptional regulator [Thermodesulfobacteriota bacterium]|nr:sigma 54-interacting transcriptional regulator [Thermodesulfobacteriota bacterium]
MSSKGAAQLPGFCSILGKSEPMLKMYKVIARAAPSSATVIIQGETGTGKELVARCVHRRSPRRNEPFVAVNCCALADTVLESELFGHEKGAFTGAIARRKGRFELADRGTLFLDEIGEVPAGVQVKLLRAIQEKKFERVGGADTMKVDVRFVTATHKNLKQGVEEGWFREDLFYRLNVIRIWLPPLRDRRSDIPSLADYFLGQYVREDGKEILAISDDAKEALMAYSFPGNVRELENIIQRAVVLAKEKEITIHDLPRDLLSGAATVNSLCTCRVRSNNLLEALKEALIYRNGRKAKKWHSTLKCVTIEKIHEFLLRTTGEPFSRPELTQFLAHRAKSDRNKYGTAGKYLSVLKKNGICVHNGKKANQSRYRLSEVFLS